MDNRAQETGALLRRRGVDWRYEVTTTQWAFTMATARCRTACRRFPQPNAATALAAAITELVLTGFDAIRDGIARATRGTFQIVVSRRAVSLMSYNPAAEYLTGRLKCCRAAGRISAAVLVCA